MVMKIKLKNIDKKILKKIILAKVLVFIFLFFVRPPTTMIVDVKMYYNLVKNPAEMIKPPGTEIKTREYKPIGWALVLYILCSIYDNWTFWGILLPFIFSTLALFFLYKITNEKIMWLFFFYPYFLYHQNFPMETSIFVFLIILSFYYLKKRNFVSNFLCNLSSIFRVEGIIFSFYLLTKKISLINLFLFFIFSLVAVYTYAYSYVYINYSFGTPFSQYPRLFIPFLIPLFINFEKFFTRHFWKVLLIWIIFGGIVGYLKVFYEWNVI